MYFLLYKGMYYKRGYNEFSVVLTEDKEKAHLFDSENKATLFGNTIFGIDKYKVVKI